MILLCSDISSLPKPNDPFALRIVSSAEAYGFNTSFLNIWQGNDCLFSLMDGVMTISGVPLPQNAEETALFAAACGGQVFLCSKEAADTLDLRITEQGKVLCLDKPTHHICEDFDMPSPKILYEVISSCKSESFPVPDFEPFYLDISHRLRHNTAKAVLLFENGVPAACAVAAAVCKESALITAVAVKPEFRRKGLGKKAVETLCGKLSSKKIFLFRSETENREFYEKLGFVPCGNWVQAKL